MASKQPGNMSFLEYNVLLGLLDGPQHGYALIQIINQNSGGSLSPRAGSLYRVLARLMGWKLVVEAAAPTDAEPHPGLERKYYELTPQGVEAVKLEAQRLRAAAELAEQRLAGR